MSGLPIDDLGCSSSPTSPMDLIDFLTPPSEDEETFYPAVWPTVVTMDAVGAARHTTTTGIMKMGTMLTDAMRIFLVEIQANLDQDSRLLRTTRKDGATTSDQAVLSPRFVEAMMGFPDGWTVCVPSATPSSLASPPSLGKTC
jgi:hypothetical protein